VNAAMAFADSVFHTVSIWWWWYDWKRPQPFPSGEQWRYVFSLF